MNKSHELVRGIYSTTQPNKDILLTEELVEIKHGDLKADGIAKVFMMLLPKPRLLIDINLQKFPFGPFDLIKEKSVLVFTSRGESIEVLITTISGGPKEFRIIAIPFKEPVIFSTSRNASRIVFHILNFPNFLGIQQVVETIDGKPYPRGGVILEYNDWQIIINTAMNYKELEKVINHLKSKGGFAITHIGLVKKSDGRTFK